MPKVNINLEIGYELAERGIHYFVEGKRTGEVHKFSYSNELEKQILEDFNKKYLLCKEGDIMIVRLYDEKDKKARNYIHFAFYKKGEFVREVYLQDARITEDEEFSDLMVGGDYCLFYDNVDDFYIEFFDKKIKLLNREGEVVRDIEFSFFWNLKNRLCKLV